MMLFRKVELNALIQLLNTTFKEEYHHLGDGLSLALHHTLF